MWLSVLIAEIANNEPTSIVQPNIGVGSIPRKLYTTKYATEIEIAPFKRPQKKECRVDPAIMRIGRSTNDVIKLVTIVETNQVKKATAMRRKTCMINSFIVLKKENCAVRLYLEFAFVENTAKFSFSKMRNKGV